MGAAVARYVGAFVPQVFYVELDSLLRVRA